MVIFTNMKLIGPFKQIVTLNNLPLRGKISDEELEIIENGGILLNDKNKIEIVAPFQDFLNGNLLSHEDIAHLQIEKVEGKKIAFPAFCRLPYAYLFWRKSSQ